jgi:hypothetical protein
MQTTYIYIVHNICASYFTSLTKALQYAWATNSKTVTTEGMSAMQATAAYQQEAASRQWYFETAGKSVREHGAFRPAWDANVPQVKITREVLK